MALKYGQRLQAAVLWLFLASVLMADESADTGKKPEADLVASSVIDEVLITGQVTAASDEMKEDTRRLFSVAGAATDPLQSIYALPGVSFAAGREPVIRGSAPQDNAYYIDRVPARYLFHVFGNSIFNKNLIHSFDLYPAAFPSRYSNATGGVIDVTLREPRQQPFTTTFSWSLLLAGIMVESEITESQAFYASYRRSQIDQFIDEDDVGEQNGIQVEQLPVSQDYQVKYNAWLDQQNSLSFIAAGARDKLGANFTEDANAVQRDPDFAGAASYRQGFDSQGLVWDWLSADGGKNLSSRVTHTGDFLDLFFGADQRYKTRANRYLVRSDFSQQLAEHTLSAGLEYEYSRYDLDINAKIVACSDFDPDCPTIDADYVEIKRKLSISTLNAYIEDRMPLTDRQWLTLGLHYSQDDYVQQQQIEPRSRWEYLLDEWKFYLAAGRYSQLPELENLLEEIGNPDLERIKSNHYVAGVEQWLNDDWRWQVDLYYKTLQDVVISINDANHPSYGSNYSNDAKGRAYGAEFLLDKSMAGDWYGWLALTLGKTERTDTITGETAPFDYDRPVILDLVLNYQLSPRWTLGIKWNYQSGGMYTPIVDLVPNQDQPDVEEPVYGQYNSRRLPDYHQLDFRAEFLDQTRWGHWSIYADILNVYNRRNIVAYDYAPNGEDTLSSNPPGFADDIPVRARSSLGFFPSIGFEIQF